MGEEGVKRRKGTSKNSQKVDLEEGTGLLERRKLGGTKLKFSDVPRWALPQGWSQWGCKVVLSRQMLSPGESWQPWASVCAYSGK